MVSFVPLHHSIFIIQTVHKTEAPKLYRLLNSDDFDTIRRLVEELIQ